MTTTYTPQAARVAGQGAQGAPGAHGANGVRAPGAPRIRVVLADDHAIVREGIRLCLESMGDIEVVGEAEDGYGAVKLTAQLAPDVVVLDVSMPRLNGIEALRQIKRDHPRAAVIILSMHDSEAYVGQALHAGAAGYVLKRTGPQELAAAVRAAHAGELYLHPAVAKRVVAGYLQGGEAGAPQAPHDRLTPREREVLQLAAEGLTTREIAEQLVVSLKTAEHHRASAMAKLDLHNQTELVKYAIRTGLIETGR
jgi:DNA-binding NarL/FixJ family response regulator